MGPGAILTVIVQAPSVTGEFPGIQSRNRNLFSAPMIINQRLWTLGYADSVDAMYEIDSGNFRFWRAATERFVDVNGKSTDAPFATQEAGIWGVGTEFTVSDLVSRLQQASISQLY